MEGAESAAAAREVGGTGIVGRGTRGQAAEGQAAARVVVVVGGGGGRDPPWAAAAEDACSGEAVVGSPFWVVAG